MRIFLRPLALVLGAVLAFAVATQTAKADIIYNNATSYSDTGAPYYAYAIYHPPIPGDESNGPVSDSFTVSSGASVTSVTFDYWVYDEYAQYGPLGSIDWSIGTSPFDTSLGSATEAPASLDYLNQIYLAVNSTYYDIYSVSISIPDVALGTGTYWLTLGGATTGDSADDASTVYDGFWDASDGASTAYFNNSQGSPIPSETFQILGSGGSGGSASTPEPSSLLLMCTGLAGLAAVIRRKLKTKTAR